MGESVEKKTVLIVCSSLGGGGAERVAANLSNFFVENNYKVHIFFWNESIQFNYSIGSEVVLTKSRNSGSSSRIFGLRRLMKEIRPSVVISFTDVSNIISFCARAFLWQKNYFIATIHSDLKARDKNTGMHLRGRLIKMAHAVACRNADKVVAVSEGARLSAIGYLNLRREGVITIYNPVLLNETLHMKPSPKLELPLKIMAAGRLTEAKDYVTMLEVVRILNYEYDIKCYLDIYGDGPLLSSLLNVVEEKRIRDLVKFKGFSKELTSLFKMYDLFLMTSRWEGFGNVLVEALAANMRIVATDCPSGPAEILSNGRFGKLAQVSCPAEIAAHVVALIKESAESKEPSEELLQHLKKFQAAAVTQKYMALFPK